MATSRASRGRREIDGEIIPKISKRGANPVARQTPDFGFRGSSFAKTRNCQDGRLPLGSGWESKEVP